MYNSLKSLVSSKPPFLTPKCVYTIVKSKENVKLQLNRVNAYNIEPQILER